jgi:hypothetical protein
MPFEPRLVSPDDGPEDDRLADDQTELDLPADLAALADQLRLDADRLAVRYPADWCDGDRPGGGGPRRVAPASGPARNMPFAWWSAVAAAVVLFAAAWGAWLLTTGRNPDDRHAVNHAQRDGFGSSRDEAGAVSESLTADAKPVRPALPLERAEPLLMQVNGPELEGVLDLMETQEKEGPLLSI